MSESSSDEMTSQICFDTKALLTRSVDLKPSPPYSLGRNKVSFFSRCILLLPCEDPQKKFIHLVSMASHKDFGNKTQDIM